MTAHTRTASFSPTITPAISPRTSTPRLVLVSASFVLEAVIVLGFVSSSIGIGAAPYPDGGHGWASPPPVKAPAQVAPAPSSASAPEPAPEPGPGPR